MTPTLTQVRDTNIENLRLIAAINGYIKKGAGSSLHSTTAQIELLQLTSRAVAEQINSGRLGNTLSQITPKLLPEEQIRLFHSLCSLMVNLDIVQSIKVESSLFD